MRIKKMWVVTASCIAAAAVGATSLTVLFWPADIGSALSTYILGFSDGTGTDVAAKNKYVANLLDKTSNVIADYKNENKNFKELDFRFTNMTPTQTTGELNYFESLDRTFKAIDPSLGINNMQRTPQTVSDGYYNKDTELMSFYWSPDYNAVGTWVKYMFTESYAIANMWVPTFQAIEQNADFSWVPSLKAEFANKLVPGVATAAGVDNKLYRGPIDILSWVASANNATTEYDVEGYYTFLGNVIGSWIQNNTSAKIQKTNVTPEKPTGVNNYSDIGVGIDYVNWIASKNPNIPFAESGPDSNIPWLTTKGFYNQTNPNSDTNYRDWYIRPSQFGARNTANIWIQQNHFENTVTPWNGSFSQAPNSQLAQMNQTGITSWTTIGDENDKEAPYQFTSLVADGILDDVSDEIVRDRLEAQMNGPDRKMELTIRPIPWVDGNGNHVTDKDGKKMYMSPQDFLAGVQAFDRSVNNGLNSNNAYFVDLAALDVKKTLEDANNKLRNESADQSAAKKFTYYFTDPSLTIIDVLDILQKQYFNALPAFHEKVQNIIDDTRYNAVTKFVGDSKLIDTSSQDFSVYYGCGDGKNQKVWSDLVFASPYTIASVTDQTINYKLNTSYYAAFSELHNDPFYINFNLEKNGMKRINDISVKYAGSYNENILFEQFKSKEIDLSPVPTSSLDLVVNNYANNIRYVKALKINKSNVIAYNLQIYQKWDEDRNLTPAGHGPAIGIILDQDGIPMWNPITRQPTYTIDKYGNYVFPAGKSPRLKSRVSQQYADLIVKDFYTPFDEGGRSHTIRYTINNTINWNSIKTLYTPGVTQSIQYSFMPYGVYRFNDDTDPLHPIEGEYWDLVANKRYNTFDPGKPFDTTLKARQTGDIIWTYDELRKAMIKENE